MALVEQGLANEWADVEQVEAMSTGELDRLPIGAIQLDGDGNILKYNLTEGKISGRDPKRVLGKNFFTEVAPCTDVQAFAGRFREGYQQRHLEEVFPYTFDFKMQPTKVWVRLFYSKNTNTAWVFVRRRES
jgi:photoactive yellow protein